MEVISVLCAVLTILPVSWSGPVDVGLCQNKILACQCGTPGFSFNLEIKQCTHFYRWKPKCKPCQDTDEKALCDQYTHCLDCKSDIDGCVKCPTSRYGRWCQLECTCQNGGSCDDTGRCICLPGFQGNQCETTAECSMPLLTEHVIAQPNTPTHSLGSKITLQCEDGFLLEGVSEMKCVENGRWSNVAPICLPLCSALPSLEHGFTKVPSGRAVPGTMAFFRCDPGYNLSGPLSRRCEETGIWSETQPKCLTSVECPQPTIPSNSIIQDSSSKSPFSPGSTLSLQCKNGFKVEGADKMTCDENGKWSPEAVTCVRDGVTCTSPGPLMNGKIKVEDGVDEGSIQAMNTRLQFSCEPMYFLLGSSDATCLENGSWSASLPICMKVPTCSNLDMLNGGVSYLKPDATTGPIRTFSSSATSFSMNRRTGTGGRFRPNSHQQVEPLQSDEKSALKMTLPEGFHHVGTQAFLDCESRYYRLEGSSTRTCTASGKWSGRPTTCIPVCGKSSDPRTPFITHGTPSNIGQWPWIVGVSRLTLDNDYVLHCGASLIDERWIITAAHCVTYEKERTLIPKNELKFYAGKYYWDNSLDDSEVQVRKADAIHVHPDYNPSLLESDIALVRLSQPVQLTSRVQPVCLPSFDPIESQDRLKEGNRGVVVGWGTTEKGNNSDRLLHIPVPVIPTSKCVQSYKEAGINVDITSNMFCAGYETGKHDACNGDSGGPFVLPADATNTRFILEGIVSWGSPKGCGLEKQYGGYVRVQRFVDWIHSFV